MLPAPILPRVSRETFVSRLTGRPVSLFGYYGGMNVKARFVCNLGHTWITVPTKICKGQGCPTCLHDSLKTPESEVLKRLDGTGLTMLDPYINTETRVRFLCGFGHVWQTKPSHVFRGAGCPYCHGNGRLSIETIQSRLQAKNIKMLETVKSTSHKALFHCQAGHEWRASLGSLLHSSVGCPICAPHGFKQNLPALVYLYELFVGELAGIGFGVTNNFPLRHRQHVQTFSKNQIAWTLLSTHDFSTGEEALDVERQIKKSEFRIGSTVKGFINEFLSIESKEFLQSIFNKP